MVKKCLYSNEEKFHKNQFCFLVIYEIILIASCILKHKQDLPTDSDLHISQWWIAEIEKGAMASFYLKNKHVCKV